MKNIDTLVLKKILLKTFSIAVLGFYSFSVQAALVDGQTIMSITSGEIIQAPLVDPDSPTGDCFRKKNGNCFTIGMAAGSYFTMGGAAPVNGVMLSGFDGILLGQNQAAGTASHGGAPLSDDTGAVTAGWSYFGQSGHEFTVNNGVTVQSETANTAVLDFSNWRVTWNGIPEVNMGGSPAHGDTSSANMSCWGDSLFSTAQACNNGSFYTLDYAATVPPGDPSGFGGVPYALHLEGSISAVPVPAAVWLFASGLIGLFGIARKKV